MKKLVGIWFRPEFTLKRRVLGNMLFAGPLNVVLCLAFTGLPRSYWWWDPLFNWVTGTIGCTVFQAILWPLPKTASPEQAGGRLLENAGDGQDQTGSARRRRRLAILIWFGVLLSVAMYFLLIRLVAPPRTVHDPVLVTTLLVLAVGLAAGSFAGKQWLRSAVGLPQDPEAREVAAQIFALALCDAAALLGVVVAFRTGSPRYQWFLLVGFAAIVLHFPKRKA